MKVSMEKREETAKKADSDTDEIARGGKGDKRDRARRTAAEAWSAGSETNVSVLRASVRPQWRLEPLLASNITSPSHACCTMFVEIAVQCVPRSQAALNPPFPLPPYARCTLLF